MEEARLTHLAYAPEIAQAMLRRQQAEAVIAARQKIVHGAVSMVEMALQDLAEKHVHRARRRAQGGDGQQPAWSCSAARARSPGRQHRHPVSVMRPWFGPKRYGWGLTPVSWQGWVLTAAYVAAVFALAVTLATSQPWVFWTLLVAVTVAYFAGALPHAQDVMAMERTAKPARTGR